MLCWADTARSVSRPPHIGSTNHVSTLDPAVPSGSWASTPPTAGIQVSSSMRWTSRTDAIAGAARGSSVRIAASRSVARRSWRRRASSRNRSYPNAVTTNCRKPSRRCASPLRRRVAPSAPRAAATRRPPSRVGIGPSRGRPGTDPRAVLARRRRPLCVADRRWIARPAGPQTVATAGPEREVERRRWCQWVERSTSPPKRGGVATPSEI